MDQGLPPGYESPDGSQKSIDNDIDTEVKMKIEIGETKSHKARLLFQRTLHKE